MHCFSPSWAVGWENGSDIKRLTHQKLSQSIQDDREDFLPQPVWASVRTLGTFDVHPTSTVGGCGEAEDDPRKQSCLSPTPRPVPPWTSKECAPYDGHLFTLPKES